MQFCFKYILIVALLVPGCVSQAALLSDSEELASIIKEYETYKRPEAPGKWPNYNAAALNEEKQVMQSLLLRLEKLDPKALSLEETINKDFLELVIDDRLFNITVEKHLFPLDAEGGFITNVFYSIQEKTVRSEQDLKQYLERLATLPAYFDQRIEHLKQGQKIGKSSPKLVTKDCINLVETVLNTPMENSAFLKPVADFSPNNATVRQLVQTEIFPAYRRLKTYLETEYLVNAPEAIGISQITDGKAFYEQRTRYFATYDITPQEVFDLGQREVKRIKGEMDAILEELEFEGSYADFLNFLRTDPQFYAKTDREILDFGANITNRMQAKMLNYFGKLQRVPLTVTPVPAELAPNYTAGRYSEGSIVNKKAGEFWINTYDLPSRPLYALPALALHEGIPGHHLQNMLALEMEDVPAYRKTTYISAFGEGWALYAEHLGQEAGIYQTPYEEFGRLTYEMWRACRLVVDPGMHYFGWTRQEAVDFLGSNTALSLREVNSEINRYVGWPGQAISYKLGELKIKELRAKAERELGTHFDITEFHDVVLENGSIPLNTLSKVVEHYIERTKKKEEG